MIPVRRVFIETSSFRCQASFRIPDKKPNKGEREGRGVSD
jgi:hypothetical protein